MDPAKMKVVDLRSELGALGLETKGNKPALVERLKKALEAKTGKVIADTTILDTSTEDGDDPATPRKPGPAARTRRRSSSSRLAGCTPAKQAREEAPPEPILEDPKEESSSSSEREPSPPPRPPPQPVPAPPQHARSPEQETVRTVEKPHDDEVYCVEDDRSRSPILVRDDKEDPAMEVDEDQILGGDSNESSNDKAASDENVDKVQSEMKDMNDGNDKNDCKDKNDNEDKKPEGSEKDDDENSKESVKRELTEEEEWDLLNERLKVREQERLERERLQREEDAKRLADLSDDPVRLNRLKRKHEKKARWSNFYRSVEVTNEVLTPPAETVIQKDKDKGKKDAAEVKMQEPEINEHNITLSWYDSDLNQYLEVPELNSVVPLSEGAFFHAWAGARASHGVLRGRVCYEVRVGAVVTTTETAEKDTISSGLRIGWSSEDSTLHLGEGELSWGLESTGRAVHNGEFKEYGQQLNEKDVVGAYLDLESSPCKMSYTVNGTPLGAAYEFDRSELKGKPLFPHVLTKNTCYKVNFGYDRYNMLTKTKIVRKRIEIPIEQVLEEKRVREEEIQKQKEEAQRKERERRERERKEREERQRKKREEKERIEREKKEKEAQEKRDKGEEVPGEESGDKEKEKEKEMEVEVQPDQAEEKNEPQENGEKAADSQLSVEVKVEPMETEPEGKPAPDKELEVKEEVKAPEAAVVSEVTEEQVLKGHVLDKRIKFVIRYTVEEELDGHEACLEPGYALICHADLEDGPTRPAALADCEVILMVGMPGSGKTYWARQHAAAHPERRYNILSTGALFDKMKVDCKPFRACHEGRWDAMVTKCAKCVLKLLESAKGRRRNYILDQTNVYPSAQRRKLREFDGYRRVAVVIVTDEETYRERQKRREEADGKEVPDGAVVDMKANFSLPEKGAWLDEVIFPELDEEECKKVIDGFHKEAKAAGVVREKERRDRSESRDAAPNKRQRSDDRKRRDDRRSRDFGGGRDRSSGDDRWSGGGGSRWGPAGGRGGGAMGGGGGGRWGGAGGGGGGRDRGPPPGRFDRWGGGGGGGRNDFGGGRDRDGFRGGRGGPGGPGGPGGRGDRGPGGPGGPGGPRGPPGGNQNRFDRGGDRNNRGPGGPGGPGDKRPGGPGQGDRGAGGGGAGTWQRGGQAAAQNNRGGGAMQARAGPPGPPAQRNNKVQMDRTRTSKTNSRAGTSGQAAGAAGATGTRTKPAGATGVIGATGATRRRRRRAARAARRRPARRARRAPPSSNNSSGRPTTRRSSGTSGSSGSNSSRAGRGTNKATSRHPPPRTRRRGRNIIRITAAPTRRRRARRRRAPSTRSDGGAPGYVLKALPSSVCIVNTRSGCRRHGASQTTYINKQHA